MRKSLFAVLLLTAMPAPAHHSFAAEYDADKFITLTGTVTKFDWTNPHSWLFIEAKDENGNVTPWAFEMSAPGPLVRRGWRRGELKEGDVVTIDGFRAKDGRNVANARMVTLPDGRKLFGGFGSTPRDPGK